MNIEQRKLLARRLRAATKHQPEISILRDKLLAFGGVELVAPPFPDLDIPALINGGILMPGPVVVRAMARSACHQNVATLWLDRRGRTLTTLTGVCTGYSLSEDGLWRQHSWGACHGSIVETTVGRLKYFGLMLQGREAKMFAVANGPN